MHGASKAKSAMRKTNTTVEHSKINVKHAISQTNGKSKYHVRTFHEHIKQHIKNQKKRNTLSQHQSWNRAGPVFR